MEQNLQGIECIKPQRLERYASSRKMQLALSIVAAGLPLWRAARVIDETATELRAWIEMHTGPAGEDICDAAAWCLLDASCWLSNAALGPCCLSAREVAQALDGNPLPG